MENNTITEYTDITKAVYDSLDKSIAEIADLQNVDAELTRKINSKVYSQDYVRSDLIPKREQVKGQINHAVASAINNAESLVSQYTAVADRKNTLDPELITEDVKLLQPPIILHKKDILDILERNKDNRTMIQITLRYAEANGIDLDGMQGKYWIPNEAEIVTKTLRDNVHYIEKWIKTPKAKEMLDKFFGIAR